MNNPNNDPRFVQPPQPPPSTTRIEINYDAHELHTLGAILKEAPSVTVLNDIADQIEQWLVDDTWSVDITEHMTAFVSKIRTEAKLRSAATVAERQSLRSKLASAVVAAVERQRAGSDLSPTLRNAVDRVKERWVRLKFMGQEVDGFTLSAAMLAAYVSGVNLDDQSPIASEVKADQPEQVPTPPSREEMMSSRKYEGMNVGGVFRCCADTLSDYLEKDGPSSKAGDTVQCKHASDDSLHRLVYDGSVWRSCESDEVDGMPQTVVNGVVEN